MGHVRRAVLRPSGPAPASLLITASTAIRSGAISPLTGYVELRYDEEQKRVAYSPVKLNQAYRSFDFLSPWEGAPEYVLPGDEKAKAAGNK